VTARDPLFSVLIATYDRPALLGEAVASVLAQTLDDFECIVIDDAAPTPATCPDDARVRLIRREANGGQGASYNTGLGVARGRYVTFLDDDDLYTPDRLAATLEGFAMAPVVICQSRIVDASGRERLTSRSLEGDVGDSIREQLTPNIGQTAVERSAMLAFDERLRASADVEWWIRMAQRVPVTTVAAVGLIRRVQTGPRHGNDHEARVRALRAMLDMHADYFRRHPRAAAFQWQRIGIKALGIGDRRTAVRALARSLWLRPDRQALSRLVRAIATRPASSRSGRRSGGRAGVP
jgi:glycosyltransferase involved in cell wall biosynthesis